MTITNMGGNPLPAEGLCEVLSLISRRWGQEKFALVQEVHRAEREAEDGWCTYGYRSLAERAGRRNARYAAASLDRLNRVDHVLLVGERGSGSRGTAYRVNPNPRSWRVPWRLPAQVVEARLETVEHLSAALASAAMLDDYVHSALGEIAALTSRSAAISSREITRKPRTISRSAAQNRGTKNRPRRDLEALAGPSDGSAAPPYTLPLVVKDLNEGQRGATAPEPKAERLTDGAREVLNALEAHQGVALWPNSKPRRALVDAMAGEPDMEGALLGYVRTLGLVLPRTPSVLIDALLDWWDKTGREQVRRRRELGARVADADAATEPADATALGTDFAAARRRLYAPSADGAA